MTTPLGPEAFQELTGVSRETLDRLRAYEALLARWTQRINLVGAASLGDIWRRHMLDSAQLMALLPPRTGPATGALRVLDLGSGAGFPGLVLAIMGAGVVDLVEADQRKAVFLREAARETDAQVTVHARRVESLDPFPVDVLTARAFAPLPRLLDYASPFFKAAEMAGLRPVGLFPKGARAEEELVEARKKWRFTVKKVPSLSHGSAIVLTIRPQGLV